MTYRRLFATILIVPLLWAGRPTQPAPTPGADHHIHIPSETTAEHLRTAADFDIEAKSGKDVVELLDEAGAETGVLLSLAYMFGWPGADVPNEYAKVRRENDYVATLRDLPLDDRRLRDVFNNTAPYLDDESS